METITDIALVENGNYKVSIYNLCKLLEVKLPDTFGNQHYEITIHDDFAEVVLNMPTQMMAEDLTDILEKNIGVNVMYASKEEQGRIVKVEAYSAPVENSMYIIYISSSQHGVVDSITVFFFESLEIMYHHLRKDYQGITKVEADIIEKQSLADLVSIFI